MTTATASKWMARVKQSSGEDRGWLDSWRHNRDTTPGRERGEILVVMHPVMSRGGACHYVHTLPFRTTRKDKDGVEKDVLAWLKFSSPEDEQTCQNLQRRDRETDRLRFPPVIDPILLFREWIRGSVVSGNLGPDEVLMRWEDPKHDAKRKVIEWPAKYLADLVDGNQRTRDFWSVHLRPRREEVLVVISCTEPHRGPLLTRERGALVDAIIADISYQRQEAQKYQGDPDLGDPFVHPYAITWSYDATKDGTKKYDARRSSAPITNQILEQLQSDAPDPEDFARVRSGDKKKMREALVAAWVCTSATPPWDEFFSEWECPDPTDFDPVELERQDAVVADVRSMSNAASGDVTDVPEGAHPMPRHGSSASILSSDLEPCDESCGAWLHPQWARCPKCGRSWEVTHAAGPAEPPTLGWLQERGWYGFETDQEPEGQTIADVSADRCWACNKPLDPQSPDFCSDDDCAAPQKAQEY